MIEAVTLPPRAASQRMPQTVPQPLSHMPKSAEPRQSGYRTSRSAQSKKPAPQETQDLTMEEFDELQDVVASFEVSVPYTIEGILNADPTFEAYGPLHEGAEALLLLRCDEMHNWQAAEDEPDGCPPAVGPIYEKIGRMVAGAVLRKEVWFFRRLARFIQARREKQYVHTIPHADLDITPGPGRKLKPYDLKLVGPEAIQRIAADRYFAAHRDSSRHLSRARISREEIRKEIHEIQIERGINAPKQITDSDLSRLITQMGIRKFMVKPSRKTKKL